MRITACAKQTTVLTVQSPQASSKYSKTTMTEVKSLPWLAQSLYLLVDGLSALLCFCVTTIDCLYLNNSILHYNGMKRMNNPGNRISVGRFCTFGMVILCSYKLKLNCTNNKITDVKMNLNEILVVIKCSFPAIV